MSGTGTISAPVAARPGTATYAPEVRIATLGTDLKLAGQGEKGTLLPPDVLGDLVRADVTRVNSGASQYSLTFNNWYLSTARAISVVKYLASKGIPESRLAAAGFAEFSPLDPGDGEDAYTKNRRIEFKLDQR